MWRSQLIDVHELSDQKANSSGQREKISSLGGAKPSARLSAAGIAKLQRIKS